LSSIPQDTRNDTSIQQQISVIENGIDNSTKRYNELKAASCRLVKDLKVKLDTLNEEKKNFEDMDALLKVQNTTV
jgi:hypothetical protein